MALSAKLELRQGQGLVMTPQLQQAIKLLQLSHLDLTAYVEAELEKNPLLERADSDETPVDADSAHDAPERPANTPEAADWPEMSQSQSPGEVAAGLDTDVDNVYPDESRADGASAQAEPRFTDSGWAGMGQGSAGGFDGEGFDLEASLPARPSLHEHLAEQLAIATPDPVKRVIGRQLIDAIDEQGYLRIERESLSEQLGAPLALIDETIALIQDFDPAGIGARDLAECLAIQLRQCDRFDPAMQALTENLDLLARRDLAALRRICGVDDEDIMDMVAEIRALDPRPGARFGDTLIQSVVPDITVRAKADGSWLVELNAETLPRVLVNQDYYATVAACAREAADKAFITDCLQTANWLVKSLDQRARTILKVASEIVRQQDGFLVHGVHHLRPLNLKSVADAIAMHESTVSRVTANKYMATPRGIFELKYFFTTAIASADGGQAHSAEAVRQRIKDLIEAERAGDVLSDDQLVRILRGDGVDIARRTVAKYREALNIPSSVQRRRDRQVGV